VGCGDGHKGAALIWCPSFVDRGELHIGNFLVDVTSRRSLPVGYLSSLLERGGESRRRKKKRDDWMQFRYNCKLPGCALSRRQTDCPVTWRSAPFFNTRVVLWKPGCVFCIAPPLTRGFTSIAASCRENRTLQSVWDDLNDLAGRQVQHRRSHRSGRCHHELPGWPQAKQQPRLRFPRCPQQEPQSECPNRQSCCWFSGFFFLDWCVSRIYDLHEWLVKTMLDFIKIRRPIPEDRRLC
jgi:hypothetical protein